MLLYTYSILCEVVNTKTEQSPDTLLKIEKSLQRLNCVFGVHDGVVAVYVVKHLGAVLGRSHVLEEYIMRSCDLIYSCCSRYQL